jgi:hypothetical protein
MRVLDIGAAAGRDMALLRGMGCDVYGVEPCQELRSLAVQRHPELDGRIEPGSLPNVGEPFGGKFDGVLCSAVLMHLPRAQILDAALAMRKVLVENGRLLLSIPSERPGLDGSHRDQHGRLFTPLSVDYVQLLFERLGYQLIDLWKSQDGLCREGYSWWNLFFGIQYPQGTRPLDQIEGILNRDKKTATYKLALFRALSEVAVTAFERAHWVGEGIVGVPVADVAEKWLHYYWPIFESSTFVPQIRGEVPNCPKPVAFRSLLSRLVDHYRLRGGFTRFVLEYRAGTLPPDTASLTRQVLKVITTTITDGPVTYAGGALESGRVFRYDNDKREIHMSAAIWRELSLVGHWIQDAVVLRWAELTSKMSRAGLRASEVIDLLLTVPLLERDVGDARRVYDQARVAECTWSGKRIHRSFDIDHILPFSLWHSSDLWNLVPTSHSVNVSKRDMLPTRELLFARRDHIIGHWELLRTAHRARFDYESSKLVGVPKLTGGWQSIVFQGLADSVEFTAAQRGCERWEP